MYLYYLPSGKPILGGQIKFLKEGTYVEFNNTDGAGGHQCRRFFY